MKVAIITRYNEKIDWIEYIIDFVDQIIIFNKGSNNDIFKKYIPPPKIVIKQLPNIGRIDHTLAHYILERQARSAWGPVVNWAITPTSRATV